MPTSDNPKPAHRATDDPTCREQARLRLRALLLEGAASPLEGPMSKADFERLRARIRRTDNP